MMFKLAISRNKPFRGRGFKITDTHTGLSKLYTDRDAVLEDFVINRSFISELAKIDGLFRYRWRISYYFKD